MPMSEASGVSSKSTAVEDSLKIPAEDLMSFASPVVSTRRSMRGSDLKKN